MVLERGRDHRPKVGSSSHNEDRELLEDLAEDLEYLTIDIDVPNIYDLHRRTWRHVAGVGEKSRFILRNVVLTGVKIPCNKVRHYLYCKSRLDLEMFGMAGSIGLWTCYHSKFVVWCALKLKNDKISQLSESKLF